MLSARVAWTTVGAAAAAPAQSLAHTRGRLDAARVWVETVAVLALNCWIVPGPRREAVLLRRMLAELACRDQLAGLLNRRGFDRALAQELARNHRGGPPAALPLVDIDPPARALLTALLRPGDAVSRFGSEEFAAVIGKLALRRVDELCTTARTVARSWEHPIP